MHSFHELSPHLLCHLLKNRFVYLYVGIRTVISEFYVKQALSKPFRGLVNASDNLWCCKLPGWNVLSRCVSTNSSSLKVFWGVPFECIQCRLDWNGFFSNHVNISFFQSWCFLIMLVKTEEMIRHEFPGKAGMGNKDQGLGIDYLKKACLIFCDIKFI